MADNVLEACFYGLNTSYGEYLAKMQSIHQQVVAKSRPAELMFLEHEPVITITRQHGQKNIKTSAQAIANSGIALHVADRGGDATFHGPGQLVGYPIIPIESNKDFIDISGYIRKLESSLLLALNNLGLKNVRLLPGFSGLWVKTVGEKNQIIFKKLCAIGVGLTKGVTKHGFALNINIDHQKYCEHIIPCGLKDRGVINLTEAFLLECLLLPERLAIVNEISRCIAETYCLSLKWRINAPN